MQVWHLLFEGKETTIKTKLVFSQGMHKHMLQNILEGISGKAYSSHVKSWTERLILGGEKLRFEIRESWTLWVRKDLRNQLTTPYMSPLCQVTSREGDPCFLSEKPILFSPALIVQMVSILSSTKPPFCHFQLLILKAKEEKNSLIKSLNWPMLKKCID